MQDLEDSRTECKEASVDLIPEVSKNISSIDTSARGHSCDRVKNTASFCLV